MNFAERLKLLVAESGNDQQTVANEAGISTGAMSNYLKGRWPKTNELLKLADYFHVTTDFLLGWDKGREVLRYAATVSEALSEGLAENPVQAQEAFNEFILIVTRVRESADLLNKSLDELEIKARMVMVRKEAWKQNISSAPPSDVQHAARREGEKWDEKKKP